MRTDNLQEVKRLLLYVLKYWYFIVFSLIIALSVAYLVNKYTHRVYPVGMSFYVKEDPGSESSAAMLYNNNPLLKGNPNYYNEPYMLKAESLLERVVRKLDLHISYVKEGRVKTTEIYPGPSLKVKVENQADYPFGRFYFQHLNHEFFYLSPFNEDGVTFKVKDKFRYGEELHLFGKTFRLLKTNSEFKENEVLILTISHPASVAKAYARRINTSWTAKGASLLDVGLQTTVPEKEVAFLEELAETYSQDNVENRTENATRTIAFIDEQLQYIGDSLQLVEEQLERFKVINNTGDISGQANTLLEKLRTLESSRSAYVIRGQYYHYIKEYLKKENAVGEVIVPASVGIEDPVLSTLIGNLVSLQMEMSQLGRSSSNENPYFTNLVARLNDMRENILENIENQQANISMQQQNLDKQVAKIEKELKQLPSAEREYVNIQRMYNLSEGLYLFLMRKKAEAGITKAATTSGVRLVNAPKLLGGAISPNVQRNYMLALFAGLGFPVGLLFLFYFFNDKIRYQDDLRKLTNIPLLGAVGHSNLKSNLTVAEKSRSAVAESFRSIRSNLQFFTGNLENINGVKGGIYLITSSMSGEGKTFCSVNLATVFALSGKKTLILGADMRKPRIFQDFGLENDVGLSNYLIGQASLEDVIQQTSIENLSLITGGIVPPNPAELLVQDSMKELMQLLKNKFEVIVIDSPPLGIVSDALMLWPYADHSIYLVRQGYTRAGQIKQVDEMLQEGKIKNVSLLFNDVKVNRYGYGYYDGYGYGYGYGSKGYYTE